MGALPLATLSAENYGQLNITSITSVGSTGGEAENFGFQGHDPNDEFTLQGLEINARYFIQDAFSTSVTYTIIEGDDENLEAEAEDIYGRFHLLDNSLQLTFGQVFFNTSTENNVHVHDWNFVNGSLLTTRFYGDEGLLARGGTISYTLPTAHKSTIYVNFGEAVEEEEGEEEELAPNEVEGEASLLAEDIFAVNWTGTYLYNDFNHVNYSAHYAVGNNGLGLDAYSFGANLEYLWRENGQESGGKHFGVGAEFVRRSFDFISEDGTNSGTEFETGFAVTARYKFANTWEAGLRFEHIDGSDVVEELPEVDRLSAAITKSFNITEYIDSQVRLQYDNLHFGSEF